MGITATAAEFLIRARREGVRFDETVTIGRQNLCVSPIAVEKLLKRYGCWDDAVDRKEFHASFNLEPYFAEPFFHSLGAKKAMSIDASGFEDADFIHNMNYPVPQELHERFDVVIDGGALEHVFNYPGALKSCMEMAKVGGHVILITTVNNWLGHGFYQFSPSLFFGVFCEANGYELESTIILENDANHARVGNYLYLCETAGTWYEVSDPQEIGQRVLLTNNRPTMLLVRARRTRVAPIFERYPEEAGYEALWDKHGGQPAEKPAGPVVQRTWLSRRLGRAAELHVHFHLASAVMRRLNPWLTRRFYKDRSFRNRKYYRPVKERRG